jgi:hypothetical protein
MQWVSPQEAAVCIVPPVQMVLFLRQTLRCFPTSGEEVLQTDMICPTCASYLWKYAKFATLAKRSLRIDTMWPVIDMSLWGRAGFSTTNRSRS